MAGALLELVNVSKYYTGAQSVVMGLNAVSLRFERGEFVAVTGESGSGKSTLAQVMGGILPYESGEMLLMGRPTSHFGGLDWERWRRDNVSFISQSYGILPGATVMRNVMSALILTGMDKDAAKQTAGDILRRVDLWELRNRRAAKLSSGQKQRLSIARALAKPAPILIADEPTGNLDAENSRVIIGLLADAARERLVILVTHDFDEARDLVTRHVVLQNGAVTADTVLRPTPEPGPVPQVPAGKKRGLSPYVARLQCVSRPVWTGIMALFFAITAFAVFAFLGVFLSSLDDTYTKIYDGAAFPNGDPTRIVVLGKNLEPLTEEDFRQFLTIPHVESVETWANMADVVYGYREGRDYDIVHTQHDGYEADAAPIITEDPVLRSDAPYARTVPVLREGTRFLTAGRLPENMFEVVCGDGEHQLDDIVEVLLCDPNTMSLTGRSYITLHFKVVGLTDYGDGLFFHNDLGRLFRQIYVQKTVTRDEFQDHGFVYFPNDPYTEVPELWADPEEWYDNYWAPEGHFVGGGIFYDRLENILGTPEIAGCETVEEVYEHMQPFVLRSDDTDENGEYRQVSILPKVYKRQSGGYLYRSSTQHTFAIYNSMNVTYDVFDTLCWKTVDESGLTISDYAYTDRVLKALDKMGYAAISVYRQGAVKVDPQLANERKQTLRICLLALLVTAVLQVVVLRAMFSAEYDSFRLLSNIGLTGKTAKRAMVLQLAFLTLLGELLGAGGIAVCFAAGVGKIVDMLKYLPWPTLALLVAVHMALSALAAAWVIAALTRQVYPLGSVRNDLEMDDGEEVKA